MGDLTSSTASPNNHGHHYNYQSFHGNGKASDQIALCPSSNNPSSNSPYVGSLPLPPSASVTYEFSLAPQSGTLAPGWHLTAVQRGLATAVPLAAAVARRRLPRPRTTRPRFGFTDKNEARRAKWTIAVTALALLASMLLLVAITLRLAPFIDELVRKENENLMRVIQKTPPLANVTGTNNHTQQPPPYNEIEDQDESMDNYNNNNNLIGGQSLTKSVIKVDPGPGNVTVDSTSPRINVTTTTTTSASTTVNSYYQQSEDGRSKPLSSSLIGEILLNLSKPYNNGDSSKTTFSLDKMMQDASLLGNSETSIKAESPDIFTEPISDSDIDENEIVRARTSIVLR